MVENHAEEQQWLSKLRAGDETALDSIFEKYYRYLYAIAYQITADANLSKDMVQEVFLRIWQNKERILVTTTLKGYLQRSVINQCLTQKRSSNSRMVWTDTPLPQRDTFADVQALLEAQDLQTALQAAITELPEQCALIFRLSRFEEMSYQEIADHLGIAPKTVENQIGKALKVLRQRLGPYLGALLPLGMKIFNFC